MSLEGIRNDIDHDTREAAKAGMKAKLTEAAEMVRHMAERMEAYTPGSPGQRATGTFRDTLVTNIQDLAEMLPKINIFDDPKIDALAQEISEKLGSHHADALRQSQVHRQAVKEDAEDILERLAGYL